MTKIKTLIAHSNGDYFKITLDPITQNWVFTVQNSKGKFIAEKRYDQLEDAISEVEQNNGILDEPVNSEIIPYSFRGSVLTTWLVSLGLALIARYVLFIPGGAFSVLFTSAGLTSWVLTDSYFLRGKHKLTNVILTMSSLWFGTLFYGAFLNGGYPFNFDGLTIYLVVLAIYSMSYFFLKRSKAKRVEQELLIRKGGL